MYHQEEREARGHWEGREEIVEAPLEAGAEEAQGGQASQRHGLSENCRVQVFHTV